MEAAFFIEIVLVYLCAGSETSSRQNDGFVIFTDFRQSFFIFCDLGEKSLKIDLHKIPSIFFALSVIRTTFFLRVLFVDSILNNLL